MLNRLAILVGVALTAALGAGCSEQAKPASARPPTATSSAPRAEATADCIVARRRVSGRLMVSWGQVARARDDAKRLGAAMRGFDAEYRTSIAGLRPLGCVGGDEFTAFEDALARVNPQSPLLNNQMLDVMRALARIEGSKPSARVRLPPAASPESRKASLGAGNPSSASKLAIGQTAHLPYFDVTVGDFQEAPYGVAGVRVTVCYTARHPSSLPDGSTRVSRDPWTFQARGPDGQVLERTPEWIEASEPFIPTYGESTVRVGDCRAGWITTIPPRGTVMTAARYAPRDFPFSAQWALQ